MAGSGSITDRVVRGGVRALRSVAGTDSSFERRLRHAYKARGRQTKTLTGDGFVQQMGPEFVHLQSTGQTGTPVGIFMKGSCDLPSVFAAAPLIRPELRGTFCIYRQGIGISDSRPDILLQSRERLNPEIFADVIRRGDRLNGIDEDYFRPRLFEPTFDVPELPKAGSFPKSVVVLSINPALTRTAYRHREHGFLVDPGGCWLNQSMDAVLEDLSLATWFKESFRSVGKMTVEAFYDSFGEVVRLVKEETGAKLIVYNALVVDPGNDMHNYRFTRKPQTLRRREFDLALREIAEKHDVRIMDVDRVLKLEGVQEQIDFAHFPVERMGPIADEIYRTLRDLEVL
jgi:hypothetical protein